MKKPTGIAGTVGIKITDRRLAYEACDARSYFGVYLAVVSACGDVPLLAVSLVKGCMFHVTLEKLEKVVR